MNIQIPPVTQALILANVVVYALMMFIGGGDVLAAMFSLPFAYLPLWPIGTDIGVTFGPWQLVSYSFLHGGLMHLLFNMYALYLFGGELERLFGPRWYATFYFVCVITAALAQLIVASFNNYPPYPTVGASGGVFGVLLGFGMYFPRRTLMLIIPPIPIQAWLFVTIYGLIELFLGVSGAAPGVAHFAHLGGMVGGFIMIMQRRGKGPWRRR